MSAVARQCVTNLGAHPGERHYFLILYLDGSGQSVSKVEQGVTKIDLPNVNDAQQSPYFAVLLCLVDDESYELIQAVPDVLLPKLRKLQEEGIVLTDDLIRSCRADSIPEDSQRLNSGCAQIISLSA
jgi:hypothetical protein